MRHVQIFTAVIVLMSVSSCGQADPAPPATSPAATTEKAAAEGSTAQAVTAEAAATCKLAAESPRAGEAIEIDEDAIKSIIGNAGKSGVDGIEQAGEQVKDRYSAWLDSPIGDGSAKAMDELLNAVGQVNSACKKAGVTTP